MEFPRTVNGYSIILRNQVGAPKDKDARPQAYLTSRACAGSLPVIVVWRRMECIVKAHKFLLDLLPEADNLVCADPRRESTPTIPIRLQAALLQGSCATVDRRGPW